jgi:hypothetical protein
VPALALALLLSAAPAIAAPPVEPDRRAQAAEHYQRGVTEYNLGRFDEAIGELEKAYEIDPAPILLFNIGQAHWKAGRIDKAIFFYQRFLATAPKPLTSDEARRAEEVRRRIREATEPKKSAPPPTTVPSPETASPAPPPPPPTERVPLTLTPPSEELGSDPAARQPAPVPGRFELSFGLGPAAPQFVRADLTQAIVPLVTLAGSYRVTASPPVVAVGLLVQEARLSYERTGAGGDASSHFPGLLADASVIWPQPRGFELAAQLGAGVVWWTGLVQGNPFAPFGAAATGAVPMPAARAVLAVRWRPSPNSFLALAPSYVVCKTTSGLTHTISRLGLAALVLEVGVSF